VRPERVVDASVVVKVLVDEELSEEARRFFRTPALRLYTPDFIYLECTNALWKHVRRFNMPLQNAQQTLFRLRRLRLHPVSVPPVLQSVIQLASRYGISAYDATYVSLAQAFAIPLVTADWKLFCKLKDSDVPVHWLGNLSL
jgi:predicted nucleic acid-binding protein